MSEQRFVDGLIIKDKHQNQPDFVKCKMTIKREELIAWLENEPGDWVNLDVCRSKDGQKLYATVNDWKPESKHQDEDVDTGSVPF